MPQRADKKLSQMSDRSGSPGIELTRVPDVVIDDPQTQVVDLPRPGVAKDVANLTRAKSRLPELLIDE